MSGIFINYRRLDSLHAAGRLSDALERHFGKKNVFVDVDSMEPGRTFPSQIQERIDSSHVMLVLIAHSWLSKRLRSDEDWVRQEIERGLARGEAELRLIPVLLDGADMPSMHDLPEAIRGLASCHAVGVSYGSWERDVGNLVKEIREVVWPIDASRRFQDRAITTSSRTIRRARSKLEQARAGSAQVFFAPNVRLEDLSLHLERFFRQQNLHTQTGRASDQSWLIQARSSNARAVVGMSSALSVLVTQQDDEIVVSLGRGRWLDKGVAAALSPWIPPLLLTAGLGAWKQKRLGGRVFDAVRDFLAAADGSKSARRP